MNCDDIATYLHPYLDGELDLVTGLEVEKHLATCPSCSAEHARQRALQGAIAAGGLLYFTAPAGLKPRVQAAVRREDPAGSPRAWRSRRWGWIGGAVVLALLALVAWSLLAGPFARPPAGLVAQEALSSSLRSLIAGPLVDVASSDQHTVRPWFAGKLDFAPVVQDLAAQGFPLAGGRLDYLGGRPVAALVYRHQGHVINLYTWPIAAGPPAPGPAESRQGYNLLGWSKGGMAYLAVTDMDAGELRQFAQLLQGGE